MQRLWISLLLVTGSCSVPVNRNSTLGLQIGQSAQSFCERDSFVLTRVDQSADELDMNQLQGHVDSSLNKEVSSDVLVHIGERIRLGMACVDGRSDKAHFSAPGGDVGELILGLKAVEDVSKTQFSQFQVDDILINILASESRDEFHMCTDIAALERLCQNTNFCFPRNNFESPSLEIQEILLENLVRPEFVGNEHLRLLLLYPLLYGIRRELTEMTIRAFYRVLWNHLGVPLTSASHHSVASKLDLSVYEGAHHEEGIISVVSSPKCDSYSLMIKPLVHGHSIRVYYPDAARLVRVANAELLAKEARRMRLPNIEDAQRIANAVAEMGESLFLTTLNQYATQSADDMELKAYPHYELRIPEGCCPTQFRRRYEKTPLQFSNEPPRLDRGPLKLVCASGSISIQIAPSCAPEEKLRMDGYSIREVNAHFRLSAGARVEFVDAREWGVSAVDGRSMESVLGVPGASVGQFAVVLALAEAQLGKQLDVIDLLARYIMTTKAPTFSYLVDVESLFQLCSHINACPPTNLPFEKKMRQLVAAFQKPNPENQQILISQLTKPEAFGDGLLKFAVTDIGLKQTGSSSGKLNPLQAGLLAALQKAFSSLDQLDPLTLMRQWQLSQMEFKVLSDLVRQSEETAEARNFQRLSSVLTQCLQNDPSLKGSIEPNAAMQSCSRVLKRMAVYVISEDGQNAAENSHLDGSRRHVRAMIPRVIEAFFKLLWTNAPPAYQSYAEGIAAKLDLVVVDGSHQERAFVTVRSGKSCPANMAPLFTPKQLGSDSSVWLYHPNAARHYRGDIIDFLVATEIELNSAGPDISRIASDLEDELVRRFLFENVSEHPIYDMVVGDECCPKRSSLRK